MRAMFLAVTSNGSVHKTSARLPSCSKLMPSCNEFGEIPVEVDHDLANLVLSAYRLSERRETAGSTLPANRSQ